MRNFKIEFSLSPWILLLIIPAVAFTLFFYFRVQKRFRIKRRTVSMVLHIIVFVCSIVALSGLNFSWDKDDVENELVVLVDASYSEQSSRERVDGFVHDIIEANDGRSRFAVVKFGYDQVVAVNMGKHGVSDAYDDYLKAEVSDTTATDIRSALTFIWDPTTKRSGGDTGKAIITDPESARILLISDGLQTDRDAMSVVKLMELQGIRVDTTFFPANYSQDVWIVDATYPDRSFDVGESFDLELTIRSSYAGTFDLNFSDNGDLKYSKTGLDLRAGVQTVQIPHSFASSGHHELKFGITSNGDTTIENNVYYTSYDLEENNTILILEKYEGESDFLYNIIMSRTDAAYLTVKVLNIKDAPETVDELAQYDEVILVNISHSDMSTKFEEALYDYVYKRGGGLFTVGGFEHDESGEVKTQPDDNGVIKPVAHAYNEKDLKNSKLQEMLPVEVTDVSPPTALAIIIDRSASMEMNQEQPFEMALAGALAAVDVMSPRDFVGVMTMNTSYHVELDLTPMTQKSKIIDAIYRVADDVGGSNSEEASIEHAGRALAALRSVEKKHILFITDGKPGDPPKKYLPVMQKYHDEFGITITVVSVVNDIIEELEQLAEIGEGGAYHIQNNIENELPKNLRKDLGFAEEYEGAVEMDYNPELKNHTPVVSKITQSMLDTVDMTGFFVSRAKNSTVRVALMAKYVPLYAQWTFGAGKVGSLMCDLNMYFSKGLIESEDVGVPVINNMVSTLMPVMNIREHSLEVEFIEDNYRTQTSVEGYNYESEQDKKLIAFVQSPSGEITKFDLSTLSVGGNRFTFENREPGIHDVTVIKVPRSFDVFANSIKNVGDVDDRYIMAMIHTYREFSYSEEYDAGRDSFDEGKSLLIELSSRTDAEGEEKLIDSAEGFVSSLVSVHRSYDPRYLLIGIALSLFLLEIAIRKFPFPQVKKLLRKIGLLRKNEEGNF